MNFNRLTVTINAAKCCCVFLFVCFSLGPTTAAADLRIEFDEGKSTVSVVHQELKKPVLTQNARSDFRPYLHPIVAPDGKGVLTQFSPGHHKHQTGLYWGFTRVNGRDYFHHPEGDYWKRKSVKVIRDKGESVQWRTVYDLLDAKGAAVLTEMQTWTMHVDEGGFLLDLIWKGTAQTDVTVDRYSYGGLFLRMPWKRGVTAGDAVNASGQRNREAEGKRSEWVDVGMQIEGRKDHGHIAILDHPDNKGYPQPWRVDGQMGVGPVRARLGAWKIAKGESETIRHRFVVYTGKRNAGMINKRFHAFTGKHVRANATGNKQWERSDLLALLAQTIGETKDPAIRASLMRGMLDGLAGQRNVEPPAQWAALGANLLNSDDANVRELSQRLAQIFGDEKATEQALATVRNRSATVAARRSALRLLLNLQSEGASDLLESLLDEPALALDAIRGYATVENKAAPAVLLGRYSKMPTEQRQAAIETLATRKSYATVLLRAMKQQKVSRDDIPSHVARSLASLLGHRFVEVYGEVRPVAADREKIIAKYKKLLTPDRIGAANASRGRVVFKKTCAACHILYDDGGKLGPELTGSNRANLDYILLNMVDPSYDVPDGYKMVRITTILGRVIDGLVAEEDQTRVVMKTVLQPTVVIAKEDIDTRKVLSMSMMPEGQLDKMEKQDVADLIKYLRTTRQVEMTK